MENLKNKEFLQLMPKINETYRGGRPRKKNKKDADNENKPKKSKATEKQDLVGIRERDNKKSLHKL